MAAERRIIVVFCLMASLMGLSKADGLNEKEELKLQSAFDTIFDDNPKVVLNYGQTLDQLKEVERLATVELAGVADEADEDIGKTLTLIRKMIKFGEPNTERCLNRQLLVEYLEVIQAHLMPSLWSWQKLDKAGSNGYRYVQHSKAVQHQLCRNYFWTKLKSHLGSFKPEQRAKFEKFGEMLAKHKFETDELRLVKGSVDYLESILVLPSTRWALKWSSERKHFEEAYRNEVVYLCVDYEKQMRTFIHEYNYILKDQLMVNAKSYHWVRLGDYCNTIALGPTTWTEAAYKEALNRRAYVGVQLAPTTTKDPINGTK